MGTCKDAEVTVDGNYDDKGDCNTDGHLEDYNNSNILTVQAQAAEGIDSCKERTKCGGVKDPVGLGVFDISISHIDYRYIDIF